MNDRLEYRRSLGLPKADETDLVTLLRANANEPCMTIGGRAWALEAANEIETAVAAIKAIEALKEVYRARWLSCVTPEEAERLRDEAESAKHTAIAYAKREVQDIARIEKLERALRFARERIVSDSATINRVADEFLKKMPSEKLRATREAQARIDEQAFAIIDAALAVSQ